jgi:transcriptional regulator with XRE-family HTH domain
MAILGTRVRELRKKAGLTQKQLEAQSGIPQNTISRIEIGTVQEISTRTLVQLAKTLGVSTDYLLGLAEEEDEEHLATIR